jgi:putative ABC transport system ATP-binding protein
MQIQEEAFPPPVSLRAVVKHFGSGEARVQALNGVDLEIRAGEILLLVGPSLSVIAAVLEPSGGQVEVFGCRIDKMSQHEKALFRRDRVGFVFQQFNLVPTLTAAENAAIPLLIRKQPYPRALEKARRYLVQLGLGDRTEFLPSQLSGGQQQRVAIARALIAEPSLVVCDEPTAALDGETGHQVMDLLRNIGRRPDRAVLIVTHDSRILPYGDRIAHMMDGKITGIRSNGHDKES